MIKVNTLGLRRIVGWVKRSETQRLGACWVSFLKRQVLQLPEPPVRPTALWATKRQASPRVRSSESLSERLRQRSQPPHPAGSPSGDASGTPAAGCPLRAVGRTQSPTEGNPPSGLSHRRSVYRQLWATHWLPNLQKIKFQPFFRVTCT